MGKKPGGNRGKTVEVFENFPGLAPIPKRYEIYFADLDPTVGKIFPGLTPIPYLNNRKKSI